MAEASEWRERANAAQSSLNNQLHDAAALGDDGSAARGARRGCRRRREEDREWRQQDATLPRRQSEHDHI